MSVRQSRSYQLYMYESYSNGCEALAASAAILRRRTSRASTGRRGGAFGWLCVERRRTDGASTTLGLTRGGILAGGPISARLGRSGALPGVVPCTGLPARRRGRRQSLLRQPWLPQMWGRGGLRQAAAAALPPCAAARASARP